MNPPIVLVIFSCRSGETEKLALSAAVGAVQARALIRLRRLPDEGANEGTEVLVRMQKEYVAPTEADILAADALILAASGLDYSSIPWQRFISLLGKLEEEGNLEGKVVTTLGSLSSAIGPGLITVNDPSSDPIALGRSVADKARSLKST